jgi:hypothetical protein
MIAGNQVKHVALIDRQPVKKVLKLPRGLFHILRSRNPDSESAAGLFRGAEDRIFGSFSVTASRSKTFGPNAF